MATNFLNTSNLSISWFADQNKLDHLVLRPPFQRRPVWNPEEKAFLVDSILRGYPVPEIYVYSSVGSDGSDIYSIVDGQQRLRACLEYLADGFPVVFDVHKLEPLYTLSDTPWFNKRFSQLSPDEQDRFRRYKLVVRDLEGVGEDQIRHMFNRLNQSNVTLNAQELRYSMYQGGMLAVVEQIVAKDEWERFSVFTQNQRRRMLDSEFVTELVIGYLHWPQNKKEDIDHYYRQYAADFPFAQQVTDRFTTVLEYLVKLFPNARMNRTRWYRKSDFYTLFLVLARGLINIDDVNIEWLRGRLTEFSTLVSHPPVPDEPKPVTIYRDAVERAATDRSRRLRRDEALVAFLKGEDEEVSEISELEEDEAEPEDDEFDEEYVDRTA
jgi:hypothetical protein